MKKSLITISLIVTAFALSGCGKFANGLKHTQSDWFGLNRTITLYAGNGTNIINTWHTTSKVEDRGGSCYFLDANNKAVIISGTFVIQEN